VNAELREFAEDPASFLPLAADAELIANDRYCAVVSPRGVDASRLRLEPDEVEPTVGEIRSLAPPGVGVSWLVGGSATPSDLPERLRALGCRDPEPPDEPHVSALAIDHAPPAGPDDVEVRPIETFDDFLVGLEVMLAAAPWTDEGRERQRRNVEETYERRRRRPGGEWIAYLDGRPAAHAAAIAGPRGVFLNGGGTLRWARRRGCYRALVRARWDDAVARGTPALAVHAQHGTSQPILERLGFSVVCHLHALADPPPDDKSPAGSSA
jgi:hypothetical protein